MKALIIICSILFSIGGVQASDSSVANKGKRSDVKKERMKSSLNQQVSRHIYNPGASTQGVLEGKADVMLRVLPEGDVNVVLIQTANPLMKKFIEHQVKKMKLDKNEVIAGEIFKYRFVFKAKE